MLSCQKSDSKTFIFGQALLPHNASLIQKSSLKPNFEKVQIDAVRRTIRVACNFMSAEELEEWESYLNDLEAEKAAWDNRPTVKVIKEPNGTEKGIIFTILVFRDIFTAFRRCP